MDVKRNFKIITKNHAADSRVGFVIKLISKPYGRATVMPPAWELKLRVRIRKIIFQWNLKRAPVNFSCLFRASLKFGHYLTGGLTKVTFKKEIREPQKDILTTDGLTNFE